MKRPNEAPAPDAISRLPLRLARTGLIWLTMAACVRASTPASQPDAHRDAEGMFDAADTFDAPARVTDADALPDALDAPGDEIGTPPSPAADARAEAAPICSGVCNSATPTYPSVGPDSSQGNVTMYTTEASSGGACNYGATRVMYFAAVNVNMVPGDGLGQWQGGHICGQCIEVTAVTSQGPQSVVVRIMDKCPDGYCGIDLGGTAPAAIMRDGFGRYDGTWRMVSCVGHPEVSDGPTSLFVFSGASAYWSRVLVRNPPSAVDGLDWQDTNGASGTLPYASDPENTFAIPAEVLQSNADSVAISARFRNGGTATVSLSPVELAAGSAAYPMQ